MLRAVLMVFLLAASAGTGQYTGPSSLGPFSIDKTSQLGRLYDIVGRPRDPGADHFCYKGANGPYSDQIYYNLAGPGVTFDGATEGGAARINYTGSSFTVDSGYEDHITIKIIKI